MGKCFGVDLGTSNTMIYLKGNGIVFRAPSVVTVAKSSRDVEVIASGVEAKQMTGKTPKTLAVKQPIERSIIADSDIAAEKPSLKNSTRKLWIVASSFLPRYRPFP